MSRGALRPGSSWDRGLAARPIRCSHTRALVAPMARAGGWGCNVFAGNLASAKSLVQPDIRRGLGAAGGAPILLDADLPLGDPREGRRRALGGGGPGGVVRDITIKMADGHRSGRRGCRIATLKALAEHRADPRSRFKRTHRYITDAHALPRDPQYTFSCISLRGRIVFQDGRRATSRIQVRAMRTRVASA